MTDQAFCPKCGSARVAVELSIADATRAAVGLTNEVLSSLAAGQVGKLMFESYKPAAQKARVTKVSCY